MSIILSETAIKEINHLLEDEAHKGWGLRLGVKGGGCSGLSYIMALEQNNKDTDKIFDINGIKVFIDPKSYLYLNGLKLDHTNELIGGGFKFLNTNATKNCSCGTSFSA